MALADVLAELPAGRLRTRPAAHWFAVLTPLGVPCGPVNDLAGAFALAESLGLRPTADVDGLELVSNPVRMSATPPTYRLPPPGLGGDASG